MALNNLQQLQFQMIEHYIGFCAKTYSQLKVLEVWSSSLMLKYPDIDIQSY